MNTLLITNSRCYSEAKRYLRSMKNLGDTIYYPYDFFECQLREIQEMPTSSRKQAIAQWEQHKFEATKQMIEWDNIDQFIFFFPFGYDLTETDLKEIRLAVARNKPFFDLFVRDEIRDIVYNDLNTKISVFYSW